MSAPISVNPSSGAQAGGDQKGGDIFGGSFNTGYFGRGTDYAGILEKGMIPITIIGLVALVWFLKKGK